MSEFMQRARSRVAMARGSEAPIPSRLSFRSTHDRGAAERTATERPGAASLDAAALARLPATWVGGAAMPQDATAAEPEVAAPAADQVQVGANNDQPALEEQVTAPGEKAQQQVGSGDPHIDSITLVTSPTGAAGGYPAKEDMCDLTLNKPGPYNDTTGGSVANVHQVHFHLDRGKSSQLSAKRVVDRKAEGRGQTFTKKGDDGPPVHEIKTATDDKLVIADAPGWCRKDLKSGDFPLKYSAKFILAAYDPLHLRDGQTAIIKYEVDIDKTSISQASPTNTVKETAKKV